MPVSIIQGLTMKSRLWSTFVFIGVFVLGSAAVWHFWNARSTPSAAATVAETEEPESTGVVELTPEKYEAAGIHTSPSQRQSIRLIRTVPGRIQYDDTRHISVKAATAGALIEVQVKPGDSVSAGQVLAILSSPEVGIARADVLVRENNLKLAKADLDWANSTSTGLKTMVSAIEQRKPLEEIRQSLKDRSVGKSRDTLLSAYSRYLLADSLMKSLSSAGNSGALSGRQVAERQSAFESAEASLMATTEQETYDALRLMTQAKNAHESALNTLKISQQHLVTLLGYDEPEMNDHQSAITERLSHVEVRAPFAGTIEQKLFSNSERVQLGDTLFVLADTTQVWVAANLREGEWSAIALKPNDSLTVTTPAIQGREFPASVYYIGREVSPQTNSVPLMATISNAEGLLRPGLFVRVSLPLAETREVLTVPEAAVCEHDAKSFVFVSTGERTFKQVFIERGIQEGSAIEVKQGLKAGESVVDHGAFALKSELLLEREE